jgi:hypothetical protein
MAETVAMMESRFSERVHAQDLEAPMKPTMVPVKYEQENESCAFLLTIFSYVLVVLTFPFSLFFTVKVVQEYERAVIFRLGRLMAGEFF